MTTPFAAVTDAVRTALLVAPAVAGGRVYRGKAIPMAIDKGSAVYVNARRAPGKRLDLAGMDHEWEFDLTVGAYAKATGTQDAEDAVDPVLAEVWSRMHALTAAAIPGARQVTLQPLIEWDHEMADQNIGGALLALRVRLYTTGASLATATT